MQGNTDTASLSAEDQRLIATLAGLHTTSRNTQIVRREGIADNLQLVVYLHSPSTGTAQRCAALVYDDGIDTYVFGGR